VYGVVGLLKERTAHQTPRGRRLLLPIIRVLVRGAICVNEILSGCAFVSSNNRGPAKDPHPEPAV
jgi:hypothetical protein